MSLFISYKIHIMHALGYRHKAVHELGHPVDLNSTHIIEPVIYIMLA